MAYVAVACAVEDVNVHRHDWDSGDDEDPCPMTRVTLHLDGFPSEQVVELVFENVATLRRLAAALTQLADHPFTHGVEWRVGDGVAAWAARLATR